MSRVTMTLMAAAIAASGACDHVWDGAPSRGYDLEIAGRRFSLEIAADDETRMRGLQGRSEIEPDGGMIFVFPGSAIQSFWMADCLVDIDIIYLDAQGRVTALHRMKAESPRRAEEDRTAYEGRLRHYSSVYPAQFAIELRSGTLEALGLRVESKVALDTDRLKALAR